MGSFDFNGLTDHLTGFFKALLDMMKKVYDLLQELANKVGE